MNRADALAELQAAAAALGPVETRMNATAKEAQAAAQAFVSAKDRLHEAALAYGVEQGE